MKLPVTWINILMLLTKMTIDPYFSDITCTHLIYKIYDTDFGDLVLSFICNALNICLVIVTEDTNGSLNVHLENNHKGITPLFLHKVSKHYKALSPLDIKYLWHPGRAHITDSCADDVIPRSKSGTCGDDNGSATLYDICKSTEFLYKFDYRKYEYQQWPSQVFNS